jgi:hypothetical protein
MSKFQHIFHCNKSTFLMCLLIGISIPTAKIKIEIPITFDNFDQKFCQKLKLISINTHIWLGDLNNFLFYSNWAWYTAHFKACCVWLEILFKVLSTNFFFQIIIFFYSQGCSASSRLRCSSNAWSWACQVPRLRETVNLKWKNTRNCFLKGHSHKKSFWDYLSNHRFCPS